MKLASLLQLAPKTLATAAVAVMLAASFQANAQVVFDDGKMHTISDASYAFERIEVRNGSKLKLTDGAVISAQVGPEFEFAIQVFDSSMLVIQGGVFGDDKDGPEFDNHWFSGSIAAFDQSKVIVQDGNFGREAFRSGMLAIYDEADLNVSGGIFTNDGGSGGRIETYDHARANISGGQYGSQIHSMDNSTVAISGGAFGKDNSGGRPLFYRGAVFAKDTSTVKISGGSFGVGTGFVIFSGALTIDGAAQAKISGGTFSGNSAFGNGLVLVNSSTAGANISGGYFDGTEIHVVAGQAKIAGCAFNLPFGPVLDLSAALQGVLSNGDVIDVTLTRDDSEAIIRLEEDCAL